LFVNFSEGPSIAAVEACFETMFLKASCWLAGTWHAKSQQVSREVGTVMLAADFCVCGAVLGSTTETLPDGITSGKNGCGTLVKSGTPTRNCGKNTP